MKAGNKKKAEELKKDAKEIPEKISRSEDKRKKLELEINILIIIKM